MEFPAVLGVFLTTRVWCVPGFGTGFEIALEPSELQKEAANPGEGHF